VKAIQHGKHTLHTPCSFAEIFDGFGTHFIAALQPFAAAAVDRFSWGWELIFAREGQSVCAASNSYVVRH